MGDVVGGQDQGAGGDTPGDRPVVEEGTQVDAGLAVTNATVARVAGQDAHDAAKFPQIGEPAGEGMLLGGVAGEEGGDGGGGGRREDRGDGPDAVAVEEAPRGPRRQPVGPQAVDHQQQEVGVAGDGGGRQQVEARIVRLTASGADDRGHEIDDAAAGVIRAGQVGAGQAVKCQGGGSGHGVENSG